MQHVSVVIPSFNGVQLLKKNLPSVFAMLSEGVEVVVVDDASSDSTVEWLCQTYRLTERGDIWQNTWLSVGEANERKSKDRSKMIIFTLLRNEANRRFARSCNRGVKAARHDLIFLLNNDVMPERDVLSYLQPHFLKGDVFAVGCLEVERNGQQGGKNELWFQRGMFIHSRASEFVSGPTAWVSGGSGLFAKEKFLSLGGFDVRYAPAYWEDVDLSFQARQKGWQVLFEKSAVVHHEHETTNLVALGESIMRQISWRNACFFTWKNGDIWQRIAYIVWKPYWWWKRSLGAFYEDV